LKEGGGIKKIPTHTASSSSLLGNFNGTKLLKKYESVVFGV
jgi:hypothetical protein